jgi:ABC-2 type transport system permease protein
MRDIWIVCKKELKELLSPYGDRRGSLLRVAVLCGIFGLVIPLTQKEVWVGTPLPLLFFLVVPLPIASGVVIDSFAGERERGTLETLLATRLPNSAILLGKVLSVVLYAWSITLFSILLSLITINLVKGTSGFYFYPAHIFLAGLIGSPLVAGLITGVGVFVSLKAKTVRVAQQTLSMSMLAIFFVVGFGLPALVEAVIPKAAAISLLETFTMSDLWRVIAGGLSILAVVDVTMLAVAIQQFRRTHVILE